MLSSRNIYKEDVDFAELGKQDAEFAKHLKSNGQLDFSDPEAVLQLTRALLKRDFKLQIILPPDRLCPPVPNRLNYILWIQDLLDTTSTSYSDRHDPKREVTGLDIGTGASCIYPLLGCVQYPRWKFVATDIDEKSLNYANRNITLNNLARRVKLHQSTIDGPMFPLDILQLESIDFTLCNPPFYASASELTESASLKQRPPNSACTGSPVEMVCKGGEVSFVSKMIEESLILRERVQWYTSMLGKFSSVSIIVESLRKAGIDNWAVMEFVQGSKTRRWAVAWSFGDLRPTAATARGISSLSKHLMAFPSEYNIVTTKDVKDASQILNEVLGELDLQWQWKESISTGVGFSSKNVWSRSARRQKSKATSAEDDSDASEDDMVFGFKITIGATEGSKDSTITIRWLKGRGSVLFESFCGMIKRKLVG